jgi:hypothetical protein
LQPVPVLDHRRVRTAELVTRGTAAIGKSRGLFLPFADEDVMTSVILGKVLMLAEDDRITDPSIITQIEHATA